MGEVPQSDLSNVLSISFLSESGSWVHLWPVQQTPPPIPAATPRAANCYSIGHGYFLPDLHTGRCAPTFLHSNFEYQCRLEETGSGLYLPSLSPEPAKPQQVAAGS